MTSTTKREWFARGMGALGLLAAFTIAACDNKDGGGAAPSASATASAPAPAASPAAVASAAPTASAAQPNCPPNTKFVERAWSKDAPSEPSFKGCESTGNVRMADVKLRGALEKGKDAALVLTNKSPYPIVGNVRVYAYDAAGKQLEIVSPGHSQKGDKWLDCGFAGTMTNPGQTRDITCMTKDIIPANAKTLEGELTRATWHIGDDSVSWDNPTLGPKERPMGGVK